MEIRIGYPLGTTTWREFTVDPVVAEMWYLRHTLATRTEDSWWLLLEGGGDTPPARFDLTRKPWSEHREFEPARVGLWTPTAEGFAPPWPDLLIAATELLHSNGEALARRLGIPPRQWRYILSGTARLGWAHWHTLLGWCQEALSRNDNPQLTPPAEDFRRRSARAQRFFLRQLASGLFEDAEFALYCKILGNLRHTPGRTLAHSFWEREIEVRDRTQRQDWDKFLRATTWRGVTGGLRRYLLADRKLDLDHVAEVLRTWGATDGHDAPTRLRKLALEIVGQQYAMGNDDNVAID